MLRQAAAQKWNVPADEITTGSGVLRHAASGKSARYGEMASAAAKLPAPKDVKLKDVKDFFGPAVATGTGTAVTLPMNGAEFRAFVLLPR